MKTIIKKKTHIFLALFIILGLILRLIYLDRITFGYDQARDAFAALDIWTGDAIKIIGPTTDIKGLFHGPLYWYLISPFYYFFHHDPLPVRIFLIFANVINIVLIYFLAKKLFKNSRVAYIASFLFAVSFEAVQYSRWLSNPVLALLTIPLFFYGFWFSLNNKKIGFPLMCVGLASSIQFQFFLVYLSLFLIIGAVKLYGKNLKKILILTKKAIVLYFFAALFLSSFILAEWQFKFQGLKALWRFFQQKETPVFRLNLAKFVQSLITNVGNNITGQYQFFSLVFILIVLGYVIYAWHTNSKNKKPVFFLFAWFVSPYIIYPFEKNNSYFLNVGNIYPLILITSAVIYQLAQRFKKNSIAITIVIVTIIFLGNIRLIMLNNKNGDVLFSVQKNMHLADEKKIIDYLYTESHRKVFYVNTVTNPLFINTTWSYLFDWYGKSKYGYMPVWYGYPQDGVYGSAITYNKISSQVGKTLYLIVEPSTGIPQEYIKGHSRFEDLRSQKIAEKRIGEFTIEKRIIRNVIHFSRDELYAIVKK